MKKTRLLGLLALFILLTGPHFTANSEEPPSAKEKAEKLWGNGAKKTVVFNLKECLWRALNLNRQLRVADYDIKTAEEKEDEVRKIGYPIVDYQYDVGPAPKDVSRAMDSFFSGELTVFNKARLGVGVPLQTFGKVKTGKQLARLGIQVEEEKKEEKKGVLALQVHQLYHGIQLAHEVERLIKSARDEVAKEIRKREAANKGDPTALLKLKLFHAELDRRFEESTRRQIMAREALRMTIDIDPTVRFDIKENRLDVTKRNLGPFENYEKEALKNRSDLQQLNLAYQAREKKLALEKRLPTPNLGVGAFFELGRTPGVRGQTSSTDDFSDPLNYTRAGFGLQLKGQLDFHGAASKIRQARSELFKTGIQQGLAKEAAILDVKESYLDAKNAHEEIARAEEAGKLSRQLLFLTQSSFDIGLSDPKDLVEALKSFLETRGKYYETVYNYNIAIARLDQKIGRLPQ